MSFERFSEPPELDLWEDHDRVPFLGWILAGFCLAPVTIAPLYFVSSITHFPLAILIALINVMLAPYAFLAMFVAGASPGVFKAIALVQIPAYCLIIAIAQRRGLKARNAVIGWLLIVHVVAVGVVFLIDDIRFMFS